MARIRSVKPELRTSLTAAQWPREVRYFWVLLWGYLDDHGYGQDEPRIIKGDCFPLDDDLTASDIDKWLELFTVSGSLCRFAAPDGRRYLHAVNWSDHQRPQHPALPRFPVCRLSHETVMNGSHETDMRDSRDSHEPLSGTIPGNAVSAGQSSDGDSHESLTPEGEQGGVGGGGGVAREARSRKGATILGNAILDEHRRLLKPAPPRDIARRLGEAIEELLDDPAITPDEIRAGLAMMRQKPRLGPGALSSVVDELRRIAADPSLANGSFSRRQRETDDLFDAAAQRIQARKEISR
jgi:hypothetical protein